MFSFNPTPTVTSETEGVHKLTRKANEKKEEAIVLAYANKHLFEAKGGDLPEGLGSFTLHDEKQRKSSFDALAQKDLEDELNTTSRKSEKVARTSSMSMDLTIRKTKEDNSFLVLQPDDLNYLEDLDYLYARAYKELVEEW